MQHDYVIANDTGAAVRQDINNALLAIVSQNAGVAQPSPTYAFQLWADTSVTPAILRVRDSANATWIVVGDLSKSNLGNLALAGGTLTGPLKSSPGTVAAPGISFASDSATGIYWIGANKFGLAVNGTAIMTFDAATYPQFNSTAGILMPIGTAAQRPTGTAGLMRYNSDSASFEGYSNGVWKGLGGGGGGAGFEWRKLSGTAPIDLEEFGEAVNLFGPGLSQELYATIKVPQVYSGGTQIFLYVSGYSPAATGTILLKAQSTLVQKNVSAFNSTTNQRTSTNAALTNTTANQAREFVMDLTDSSGQINSASVAGGDLIKVRLYRDPSDTDTLDLRVITNATDVKYS
jgi:hypothetical protein